MVWTSAVILYPIVWFMTLFVVLPLKVRAQHESGEVVPGTPPSAPANPMLGRRLFWTTIAATIVWAGLVTLISSGLVPIEAIDLFS